MTVEGTFSDIQGHWAQEEIQAAIDQGWVDGYPDGTFRPNATITRAEFVKMLLSATHLTPDSETIQWMKKDLTIFRRNETAPEKARMTYTPTLNDTANHWLTKQGWTEAALTFGLIVPSDYSGKNFQPNKNIQRYEIAVMADRALGLVYPASQELTQPLSFSDQDTIQDWAKGYVNEAVNAGVVSGYPDGSFGPKRTATRAEAVVMVSRMLAYMEQGAEDDLTVVLTCSEDDCTAQDITLEDTTGIVLDGTVYLPFRQVIAAWSALHTQGYPWPSYSWTPVTQTMKGYAVRDTLQVTAGSTTCTFTPDKVSTEGTLAAAPRLYRGEMMVPVYQDGWTGAGPESSFCFADGWDPATKTMTLTLW
jgi:hypothetical protein